MYRYNYSVPTVRGEPAISIRDLQVERCIAVAATVSGGRSGPQGRPGRPKWSTGPGRPGRPGVAGQSGRPGLNKASSERRDLVRVGHAVLLSMRGGRRCCDGVQQALQH